MVKSRRVRQSGEMALKWGGLISTFIISLVGLKQSHHAEKSNEMTANSVAVVQKDVARLSRRDREDRQDREIARLKARIARGDVTRSGSRAESRDFTGPMPDSTTGIQKIGKAVAAPFKAVWGWLKS